MNHHARKLLHSIFAHPISTNLTMKDLISLLTALGAEIDHKAKGRIGVSLNGHTASFHHANHALAKEEVIQVRKFLETCGITPEAFPV